MEGKMTITHAISTERLVNVLQSIALKQRTGCLTVVREHQQTQGAEKGNIFFERGDTVFALTGQEFGETALYRILNWKHVAYTFIEGMRYIPDRQITGDLIFRASRTSSATQTSQAPHTLDILRLSSIKAAEGRQTPPIGIPALPKTTSGQLPVEMVETQLLPVMSLAEIPVPTPPEMALPGTTAVQSSTDSQRDTGKHERATQCQRENLESHEYPTVPLGVTSIFRALPCATTPLVLSRLERRERVVLLLLNGKRTLHDVVMLVHHSEVDVARTLVRLLRQGYIEYIEHMREE
jgi:hypothetical protein